MNTMISRGRRVSWSVKLQSSTSRQHHREPLGLVTSKMASTDSSLSSENPAKKEDEFNEFYSEVRYFPLILAFLYTQCCR